jgi:hypothetical protein
MTTAFRPSTPTLPASTSDELLDGRYRLLERLGSGGAADVWRAHDTRLERAVAVKIFRPGATDPARERAEAEFMARCSHSGLVTVFDAGRLESGYEAPRSYLVMEVVEGSTLRERLGSGPLPVATVAAVGAQVSGALAYVHAQGVVHRDVKPANLLVADARNGDQPTVKLADFGVARMLGAEPLTEVGTTVGTANYVSPEQIRGAAVGPPSDVYSLGLVLIEALTGRMVYPGRGVEAAIARLHRRPEIPAGTGADLAGLLAAMTADDPEARPSAATVAGRLSGLGVAAAVTTAFAARDFHVAPAPATVRGVPAVAASSAGDGPPARRSRRGVVLAAVATVAALIAGVGLAVGSSDGTPAPAVPAGPSSAAQRPAASAPGSTARPSSAARTRAPATSAASTPVSQDAAATVQVARGPAAGARPAKPGPGGPRPGRHGPKHPAGKHKH